MSERDIRDAVRCEFRPQNGGWYSRCHERATSILVNRMSRSGNIYAPGPYDLRRCDRHRAIDSRTALRSEWKDTPLWGEFDADAEYARLTAEAEAQAQHAKMLADHDALLQDLTNALSRKALSEVDTKVIEGILAAYSDTATEDEPVHTLRPGSDMFHTMDCPGCQGTSFTASPRSETYWSS